MTRTRFTTLLMAALLLAGCGGDSGDGVRSGLQDEIDMLTEERDTLTEERDMARAEVRRLEGELTASENEVTRLETLIGDATNPTSTSLLGQLAAERAESARLRRELVAALGRVSDAERRADDAEADADRRIEEAERQADVSARSGLLLTALALEATDEETGVTVEHMPGQSLKFEPTGNYMRGSAAPGISGFRSASFSRQRGADGTETLYLYTNIGSPSRKHFWKVHGDQVDTITPANAMVSSFGNDRSLYQNAQGDAENRDNVSRGGTYDGYSGTFSCATGCNVAADAQGEQTFTGTWSFKASATAGGAPMQDTEYLYFGIWAFEPNTPSAAHDFKWIAGGDATDITTFGDLEGTATFNGGAIGMYVLRNQVGRDDRIGTFTAKATFTANFDDDEIDGRITDFREGGTSLAGWSAYLGSSSSAPADLDATGATGTLVTTASIGGVAATGDWDATLHGSDNPGFDDFDGDVGDVACPVSACPAADLAGVAGWFDAVSSDSNAAIAGAFAASD